MVNKYGYLSRGKTIDNDAMLTNEQALTFAIIKVANELAEANRLKRLELGHTCDIINSVLDDHAV